MNAAPEGLDLQKVKDELQKIEGVCDVHHLHVWCVSEQEVSLECHIVATDTQIVQQAAHALHDKFGIEHCNIQIEAEHSCHKCNL